MTRDHEARTATPTGPWRTATHSGQQGSCVEVAPFL